MRTFIVLAVLASVLLVGCEQFSESRQDKTAGMNGSFEVLESGLPVNWSIYTPKTIPTGDYDLVIDTSEFKEGNQSLKFVVRECSSRGGWHSPGLFQEYKATPGEAYRVSFWVQNDGSEFVIGIEGVSAQSGQGEYTIVKSKETTDAWQQYEHIYTLAEKMNALHFELNILQPGAFWIDDIKIESVSGKGELTPQWHPELPFLGG